MDRLPELRITIKSEEQQDVEIHKPDFIDFLVFQSQLISSSLTELENLNSTLNDLKDHRRKIVFTSEIKKLESHINTVHEQFDQTCRLTKTNIEMLKFNPQLSNQKVLTLSLIKNYARKLSDIVQSHHTILDAYVTETKEQERRQIELISDGRLSEGKIQEIVDSGLAQQVMNELVVSDNLDQTVELIENRHNEIVKLEKQVADVAQLFKDLAYLVDIQGDQIDSIEKHIVNAKDSTTKGETQLVKAEKYQTKSRQKLCCCAIVVIVLIILLMGVSYELS